MIESIKLPPTNFHHGGGLRPSSEEKENIQNNELNFIVQKDVGNDEKKLTSEETKQLVKELNEVSESLNTDIKFSFDDDLAEVYVTVTDKKSGRVIRKLPSEEAMKIKKSMKELVGSLFDKKV